LPKTAQRDLDVARAEFHLVVVVAVRALLPHLHRGTVAGGRAADADAFRVVAAVAERRGAVGADPLAAAFVATLLLLEQLAQSFDQLGEPAHRLDRRLLPRREFALPAPLQPFERQVYVDGGYRAYPVEVGAEGLVELVEVALVLHQRGARQEVELVDRGSD